MKANKILNGFLLTSYPRPVFSSFFSTFFLHHTPAQFSDLFFHYPMPQQTQGHQGGSPAALFYFFLPSLLFLLSAVFLSYCLLGDDDDSPRVLWKALKVLGEESEKALPPLLCALHLAAFPQKLS